MSAHGCTDAGRVRIRVDKDLELGRQDPDYMHGPEELSGMDEYAWADGP